MEKLVVKGSPTVDKIVNTSTTPIRPRKRRVKKFQSRVDNPVVDEIVNPTVIKTKKVKRKSPGKARNPGIGAIGKLITSEAKVIRQNNPSLTWKQAISKAGANYRAGKLK